MLFHLPPTLSGSRFFAIPVYWSQPAETESSWLLAVQISSFMISLLSKSVSPWKTEILSHLSLSPQYPQQGPADAYELH